MNTLSLQKKTLIAGVATGVVGLLLLLFPYQVLSPAYQDGGLSNASYYVLASLVSAVTALCVPLSAVLVSAFLVMRHAQLAREGEPPRIGGAQEGSEAL